MRHAPKDTTVLRQEPAIVKGARKRKLASHKPMHRTIKAKEGGDAHVEPSIVKGATRKLASVQVRQGGGGGSDVFNKVMKQRGY